jgi:hypothetical protein
MVVPGTYLKVISHKVHPNTPWIPADDTKMVIYLFPSNYFLMVGYWEGYEVSVATGKWEVAGEIVTLRGSLTVMKSDVVPYDRGPRRFDRQFKYQQDNYTPLLIAQEEGKGLSLLGWRGVYPFVGSRDFIPLSYPGLPSNYEEAEVLASQGHSIE